MTALPPTYSWIQTPQRQECCSHTTQYHRAVLYCGLESLLQCQCMTPVTKLLMLNLLPEIWRGKGDLEEAHMPVLTEDGSPGGFLIFFGCVSEKRRKVTKLSAEFSHRATCLRVHSFAALTLLLPMFPSGGRLRGLFENVG